MPPPSEIRGLIGKKIVEAFVGLLVLGVIAFVAFLFAPISGNLKAIWAMPEDNKARHQETTAAINSLRAEIEDVKAELASQKEIVIWSPATRFAGPITPGRNAVLVARFRRADDAVECEIIPGSGTFTFTAFEDFVPRSARVVDRQTRNLTDEFTTQEIVLQVPFNLPPGPGELRVSTAYTECPWQEDGEPPATATTDPPIPYTALERTP